MYIRVPPYVPLYHHLQVMDKRSIEQLFGRVSLVCGTNRVPRGTSWRQPCSSCHWLPYESREFSFLNNTELYKLRREAFANVTFLILRQLNQIQKMVRFCAVYRIKPHVPPLALATVNSFEFRPCGYIPQADSFTHLLKTPLSSTRVFHL